MRVKPVRVANVPNAEWFAQGLTGNQVTALGIIGECGCDQRPRDDEQRYRELTCLYGFTSFRSRFLERVLITLQLAKAMARWRLSVKSKRADC